MLKLFVEPNALLPKAYTNEQLITAVAGLLRTTTA